MVKVTEFLNGCFSRQWANASYPCSSLPKPTITSFWGVKKENLVCKKDGRWKELLSLQLFTRLISLIYFSPSTTSPLSLLPPPKERKPECLPFCLPLQMKDGQSAFGLSAVHVRFPHWDCRMTSGTTGLRSMGMVGQCEFLLWEELD